MNEMYSFMNRQIDKPVFYLTDESSNLKRDVLDYQKLAGYHMKLALMMHKHNQSKVCLILCDWALTAMIKALHISKYDNVFFPKEFTMNEIMPLVYTDSKTGLDIALFIGTMQHMSSVENGPDYPPLEPINIDKLLKRTEEVLIELSTR